jgi:hypothetical protein
MAVGVLGMPVAMLTLMVSRRRVRLGLLVLTMEVMVSRLQVVICGRVMICGVMVMLDR